MREPYEEILEGENYLRRTPGAQHEKICSFLHAQVSASLMGFASAQLLAARSVVQISPGTILRPDLALVTTANNRLWLAAEIIDSEDHRFDTVRKKVLYEEANVPRLWMIDPRYNNVEIYHGSPYGLALQQILAAREVLTENLLPTLRVSVSELFNNP